MSGCVAQLKAIERVVAGCNAAQARIKSIDTDISHLLHKTAGEIDESLRITLEKLHGVPTGLKQAMEYSLFAGGKRLRPALVTWCCEACGGDASYALAPAMAIECVHTFSLIHDDLPAIDDDDLRRGRPACHKAFGEATAILAGDALMALAFEIVAEHVRDATQSRQMLLELARATGAAGMIGGEFDDIRGEAAAPDEKTVGRIHDAKTARLIQCACRLGAIAAGADEASFDAVSEYGLQLGRAFQIADDLLDETGSAEALGKPAGKDVAAGKQTYSRAIGFENARRLGEETAAKAAAAVKEFGARGGKLSALTEYVVKRSS